VRPLVRQIFIDDFGDGKLVRDWHELVVPGDILPIVNEHGLDVVGHGDSDRGTLVKCFFLLLHVG
jgi:hypothetical protein